MNPLRVVVVDDEPAARSYLVRLLARHSDFQVVAEAAHGREAVERLEALPADVLFLDVQMPGLDGFEVLQLVEPAQVPPVVVFVTAYDAHALKAFEARALDYLLKPFDEERFDDCLARIRAHWSGVGATGLKARLAEAMPSLRAAGPMERITVKLRERILVLPVEDVDWVGAEDNYVRIHARGEGFLLRESLTSLEGRLDPRRFVRIHRSTLVNLSRITTLEPLLHGEFRVNLSTGEHLVLSRRHRPHLEALLGRF